MYIFQDTQAVAYRPTIKTELLPPIVTMISKTATYTLTAGNKKALFCLVDPILHVSKQYNSFLSTGLSTSRSLSKAGCATDAKRKKCQTITAKLTHKTCSPLFCMKLKRSSRNSFLLGSPSSSYNFRETWMGGKNKEGTGHFKSRQEISKPTICCAVSV